MSRSVSSGSVFDGIVNSPAARKSVIGSVLSASAAVNVKVALRVRPINEREAESSTQTCIELEGTTVSLRPPGADADKAKTFNFDKVFGPDVRQEHVYRCDSSSVAHCVSVALRITEIDVCLPVCLYRDVGFPLVCKVMDGFNAAILAYGQTGAGKTHTMLGFGGDDGIVPRAIADIFACVHGMSILLVNYLLLIFWGVQADSSGNHCERGR